MSKLFIFTILLCFSVSAGDAQNRRAPVKTIETKQLQAATVAEFSEAEWKILTDALQAEDWKTAALLASQYLGKLKIENEKKQLAQLRYFYLYALAGEILAASSVKVPIETDSLWKELDAAVGSFVGKEFVLPPRRFMPECKSVLNYICAVKDNDRAVRVTATNKAGTMIHSFDYVTFDETIFSGEFADQEIFLGGKLKRAEFNQDMSKLWVIRLIFEKGFARVVAASKK
jgi:plasmid stability protein